MEHLCKGSASETEGGNESSKMDESESPVVIKEEGDDAQTTCETLVKQELDETGCPIDETPSAIRKDPNVGLAKPKEDSLVGKLKVRPFSSLSETAPPTAPCSQASPCYGEVHHIPHAHQRFPHNSLFPHRHKLQSTNTKHGTNGLVINNGFSEPRVFMKNHGLQVVLNNNRGCSDLTNFWTSPAVLNRPLTMRFPALMVSVHPRSCMTGNPTASTPISTSYSPLKIPSACHRTLVPPSTNVELLRPFVPPPTHKELIRPFAPPPTTRELPTSVQNVELLPSVQNAQVLSFETACSEIQSAFSSLQNDSLFSVSNELVKEEVKSEGEAVSPKISETGVPPTHSPSTNMNIIVKDELDLGVSAGEDREQYNPNNSNNFGNHFFTSDSTENEVPAHPSTPGNTIGETGFESGFRMERFDELSDPNHFLTSDSFSGIESRYVDVDPDDLLPEGKPNGKHLCRYCDYRHNSLTVLKKHREKLHTSKYNYRCFLCTRPDTLELPSHRSLDHHVATVHRGEKRMSCPKCGASLKTTKGLKIHKAKKCRAIDPFACHLCNFTCSKMSVLRNHIPKHDKTTEACSVCLKEVKKVFMKQHMYRHTGLKSYKRSCVKCDFETSSKIKMRRHYAMTFHNRKFQCQSCKFGTNSEEIYEDHV